MVSVDSDVLEHDILIQARRNIVFAYFTDADKLIRWKGVAATLDARPGGIYRVEIDTNNIVRGTYLEVTPFERIVFSWGWEGENSPLPPGASIVEVTFSEDGGGTRVRLRHKGLPPPLRAVHADGWEHFLPRLAAEAEGRPQERDAWAM
jgi:uncharacterized protein YndB with AHSA1/START domain